MSKKNWDYQGYDDVDDYGGYFLAKNRTQKKRYNERDVIDEAIEEELEVLSPIDFDEE